jgi:hypothetical protein
MSVKTQQSKTSLKGNNLESLRATTEKEGDNIE